MAILQWEDRLSVGLTDMDDTHREFLQRLAALADADAGQFLDRLDTLLAHTRAHFAAEEALMDETAFPATQEHKAEHARVLGELAHFRANATPARRPLLLAYVRDQLPNWFMLHLLTMDTATAAHIRRVRHV